MESKTQHIQEALEHKLVEARKESIRNLSNIEHRLEFVDYYKGVEYINDAKATDINSTWYSIDCLERPIIWIASSSEHDSDFELFKEIDVRKIKAMIIMGDAREELQAFFAKRLDMIGVVNTVEEAVEHAMLLSNHDDIVLFSPACSDYNNFKHFKDAGQQFRKAVRETRL